MSPVPRLLAFVTLALVARAAQAPPPAPLAPLPSARQLAWSGLEFYAFVHFNMDTFTDREWGEGTEDPKLFAPTQLDCRQWARVAKAAGMKGIILTAKHHDGFCLWPSKLTEHDVERSPWRDGKGDVLRELSDACREAGLKFGVYLSPWDRNQPSYGDSPRYDDYFVGQLQEVLSNYGEVFEVWFDGACGEGPNGKKQVYDWPRYRETVRKLQPNAVMFSDVGPDVRWIGNENGIAGETCWSMISPEGFEPGAKGPPQEVLNSGLEDGTAWIPGECDVSIRPGWYYHASQDGQVKSLEHLLELWYASVGRNASLLLNLPVDRRGLVHENDAARLMEFKAARDAIFSKDLARGARASATNVRGGDARFAADKVLDGDPGTYWAVDDGVIDARLTLMLDKPTLIDHVVLGEALALGQRVKRFELVLWRTGAGSPVAQGTTIGRKRILHFEPCECDRIELVILDARAGSTIATFEAFCSPPEVEIRAADTVFLDKTSVELVANQPGAEVRYTLDGSAPTSASPLYAKPIELTHSAVVTAIALREGRASVIPARTAFTGYTRESLKPALHFLRAPDPRLAVDVYDGGWQSLVELPQRKPLATATSAAIDLALRPRDEQFALVFRGSVRAPDDGLYTFAATSDDGSRVYVDDELVVDNDGLHGPQRRSGAIGLQKGFHLLRVEYFNAGGGRALEVTWRGPGFGEQALPASALFH